MKSLKLSALISTAAIAADIKPDLQFEPIDVGVKMIRSIAEGLKLYNHIENLNICDYHSQNYFTTLVDSVSVVKQAER